MSLCTEFRRWTTENVLMPVGRAIEAVRSLCQDVPEWVEREVLRPIETFRTQEEQRCAEQPCNWWCLCCNKLFCWIETLVLKIIEWVIEIVGEWLVRTVCEIVTEIVDIIVTFVLVVVRAVVSFVVCLFTDPAQAFFSVLDVWYAIVDRVDRTYGLVKRVLAAAAELVDILARGAEKVLSSFGDVGRSIAAVIKWAAAVVGGALNIVRAWFGVWVDANLGILRLDFCRVGVAVGNAGAAAVETLFEFGRMAGGLYGAGREIFSRSGTKSIIEAALTAAFSGEQLAQARQHIRLASDDFGLPVRPTLRRMRIRSRGSEVDLRVLWRSGAIDLLQAAGYPSICKDSVYTSPRREVVYQDTSIPVSFSDLMLFGREGAAAVAPFEVYAITRERFDEYVGLARKKLAQLGLDFTREPLLPMDVASASELMLDPNSSAPQTALLGRLGRFPDGAPPLSGNGVVRINEYCRPPLIAIFGYGPIRDSSGTILPGQITGLATLPGFTGVATGTTFRDRQPADFFRWAVVHEIGHYFNLGHVSGLENIMFSANAPGLVPVTPGTIPEYILFTGEPNFDAGQVTVMWVFLTTSARRCLLGMEI